MWTIGANVLNEVTENQQILFPKLQRRTAVTIALRRNTACKETSDAAGLLCMTWMASIGLTMGLFRVLIHKKAYLAK
jgi:hypothetical protein